MNFFFTHASSSQSLATCNRRGYVRRVPRESLVGQTIAGYSLQSEVGEGGTSAVFRAQHADHGTVAVKVLRDKLRQDRTAVARFLREARYGERVQHPNVVRTIEIGEAGPGFTSSQSSGPPARSSRYAKRQGPLPTDEVCAIVKQIADAVHAAHSVGIVHRDLKPENVMYDPASRAVKLLDFGIATDTDISPEQRLTRAGFFVGTLMYVAPEALSGELVGPLADQYSLATIAYFLLTGCLPFRRRRRAKCSRSCCLSRPSRSIRRSPAFAFRFPVEAVVMRGLSKGAGESATPTSLPSRKTFATRHSCRSRTKKSGFGAKFASMFRKDLEPGTLIR
jgi:serine/threonine-protein kinase